MFVWELVSVRLRGSGWDVWHTTESTGAHDGPTYRVHLRRPGFSTVVTGPTLTEAYAEAARRAREHAGPSAPAPQAVAAPHFGRAWAAARS
jgi:hypothetical protein